MATIPVTLINFTTIDQGERGVLTFIEGNTHIPFDIQRVFYVYGVESYDVVRGQHIHKECHQVLIAISGSVRVYDTTGNWRLNSPAQGLYIPPGTLIRIREFSRDCVLLVLCSHHFSEDDYVGTTQG